MAGLEGFGDWADAVPAGVGGWFAYAILSTTGAIQRSAMESVRLHVCDSMARFLSVYGFGSGPLPAGGGGGDGHCVGAVVTANFGSSFAAGGFTDPAGAGAGGLGQLFPPIVCALGSWPLPEPPPIGSVGVVGSGLGAVAGAGSVGREGAGAGARLGPGPGPDDLTSVETAHATSAASTDAI